MEREGAIMGKGNEFSSCELSLKIIPVLKTGVGQQKLSRRHWSRLLTFWQCVLFKSHLFSVVSLQQTSSCCLLVNL